MIMTFNALVFLASSKTLLLFFRGAVLMGLACVQNTTDLKSNPMALKIDFSAAR